MCTKNGNGIIQSENKLHRIFNGKYFKILEEKSCYTSITAQCIICLPRNVEVKEHFTTVANFCGHLKRMHSKEYQDYMNSKVKPTKSANKQSKSGEPMSEKLTVREQFEINVTTFVISAMIPLRSVENVHFRKIFDDLGVVAKVGTVSRRKVGRIINFLYEKKVDEIKFELKNINFVCTTADIWSGRRRSFLGVTAHWISQAYVRKSAALACCRFAGTHSFDRIAEILDNIHNNFGLNREKIVATCTDNASNFAKAFKVFGLQGTYINELPLNTSMEDDENNKENVMKVEEEEQQEDDEEELEESEEEISYLNTESNESIIDFKLPRQIRCAAQTLNLCITSDLMRTINENQNLSVTHGDVLAKCNLLWKASSRPKAAETVEKVLGHILSRPGETRWNSLYDALRQILSAKGKIIELMRQLGMKNLFRSNDFIYIEEHLKCTQPIAEAVDILQGDKYNFYGLLLPTLLTVRRKLQRLISTEWLFCKPVNEALLLSIERRFDEFFTFSSKEAGNAAIAALSHPHFKNSWLSWVEEDCRTKILQHFQKLMAESMAKRLESSPTSDKDGIIARSYNSFFNFGQSEDATDDFTAKCDIQKVHFFQDPCMEWIMLDTYPDIKSIFIEYNTPLPSSASVERLLSYATMTNSAKCNKLCDGNFEKRVILKANESRN